jgi:hypothetical protein
LERKRGAKTVNRWLGAPCVLAVCICICIAQGEAAAQSATSSDTTSAGSQQTTKKTDGAKATSSKAGSSSAAKAHSAAHPATSKGAKATTAVAHNSKTAKASGRKNSKKKTTARGQQKIDSERAEAIQEALIREHYMTGEPTGSWNQASEDAMRRYQADHGWQSKQVPDSRALISLGLGPSHDHLLNPESAMTAGTDVTHTASATPSSQSPVSHSTDPGAHMTPNPTPAPAAAPASSPDASRPQ